MQQADLPQGRRCKPDAAVTESLKVIKLLLNT